jgi:hypothetical protein
MTKKLLRAIAPEIDKTLGTLKDKVFDPDPIVGKIPSKITSIVSSVYKRHGTIIEKALLEIMKSRKHFDRPPSSGPGRMLVYCGLLRHCRL